MKKAAEYAATYNAADTNATKVEALQEIIIGFVREIGELMEQRTPTTGRALRAIIREQEQKWQAMARRTDDLSPDGFREVVLPKALPILEQLIAELDQRTV